MGQTSIKHSLIRLECGEEIEGVSAQKSLLHYSLLKIISGNTYKQNLTILALREGGINFSTQRHSLPLCARTIWDLHLDAALTIPAYEKPVGAVRPAEASDWGATEEALVCKAIDQADKWQKPEWSGFWRSDSKGRHGHSQHQCPTNVWILTRSLSVEDSALSGEKKTCEILDDMDLHKSPS